MTMDSDLELLLVTFPGLEQALLAEVVEQGFRSPRPIVGGVVVTGGWPEVWRANLCLRGVSKVLVRVASFRAHHLAQLDKRARRVPWNEILRPGVAVRVDATCKGSRIYHGGAAAQRIAQAITDVGGCPVSDTADVSVKARIHNDVCTISIDSSGDGLHKRGHKEAVNRAPMRETMAALFLRQSGFTGEEPVLDPMCGSGTFPIEAAEIAGGLVPGRDRRFAFESLVSFDPDGWEALKVAHARPALAAEQPGVQFFGRDRDAGAIRMSGENAERAGVAAVTDWSCRPVSDLLRPAGPPGLVIVNPPYGGRIGDRKKLGPLYRALGQALATRFKGWRVGIITNDPSLVAASGLPIATVGEPVQHGGIRVALYQTAALG